MTDNLRATVYSDGSGIPLVEDRQEWSQLNRGAFVWYENRRELARTLYGCLYNFYAVLDDRGLCPVGWHVPSDREWSELLDYLGGHDVAGGKLKSESGWLEPNVGATDESGFQALPGGGRGRLGGFGEMGVHGTWWSSTEYDETYAWHVGLNHEKAGVQRNPGHKASGFSVRCVKN